MEIDPPEPSWRV
jgi:hypothetical protein